jgi:hypothetical protein
VRFSTEAPQRLRIAREPLRAICGMSLVLLVAMTPSETRELILHQHVQIRILLTEIDGDCRGIVDEQRLRRRVLALVSALREHLALEERLLPGILRDADAWGQERLSAMSVEHLRQREELTELAELARRGAAVVVAERAHRLIGELRDDMDGEESHLLAPELLRDDVIAIDQSTD